MNVRSLVAGVLALTVVGTATAQFGSGNRGNLELGSDAPGVQVSEWVYGDDFESFTEGQVYVVQFFETRDDDSDRLIPRLTELQKTLGASVMFIGITDEDPDTVRPFMTELGDRGHVQVGCDDNSRTSRAWLQGRNSRDLPVAFVVDQKKKIVFIGDPMDDEFESIVVQIVSGRYDPDAIEKAAPMLEQVKHSVRVKDWRVCLNYLDQVIAMNPFVFNHVAVDKFRILLMEKEAADEAAAFADNEFTMLYSNDPETMRLLATSILTKKEWQLKGEEGGENLLELALSLAEDANGVEGSPVSMSTLAMALYFNGEVKAAVSTQRMAYLMADLNDKVEMKRRLDQYMGNTSSRR